MNCSLLYLTRTVQKAILFLSEEVQITYAQEVYGRVLLPFIIFTAYLDYVTVKGKLFGIKRNN